MIQNLNVHCTLVDDRSSVDILYLEAFKKMGLDNRVLKPSTSPLFGFMNNYITPVGTITLPITLGDYPRQATCMANFVVVDCQSAFNVVIGRPHTEKFKSHLLYLSHASEVPNSRGDWAGERNLKRSKKMLPLIGKKGFTRKKSSSRP